METLDEHAVAVFSMLGFIIMILLGIVGFGMKLWLIDFMKWKTEIKSSIEGLRTELHRDIVRLWRHIGVIEGKLQIPANPDKLNGDEDQ